MLNIKNLSIYHKKDLKPIVENFSFTLNNEIRKFAIIGEEGNGKSTLLKAIVNPELVESYVEISGDISVKNEIIGYLPQSVGNGWNELSAQEIINKNYPIEEFDYNLFYSILSLLDFNPEIIENNIHAKDLSGGEKIKFALVLELLKEPTLLLLDEPSNDLDIDSVETIEKFIKSADIPIIFVSHDESLLEKCSDGVILLEQFNNKSVASHTIANLNYREFIRQREDAFSKQVKLANKEKAEFDAKMERYRHVYDRVNHELRTVSRQEPHVAKNLKDKMHSVKSMGKRLEKEKENMTQIPDIETSINIKFDSNLSIANGKKVLDVNIPVLKADDKILSKNINLHLYGNEKICIVGKNGAGKTTLLHRIMDELEKSDITCGYMPQNYDENFNNTVTPIEFLTKDFSKDEHTQIRTYLGSLKFTKEEMMRPISGLSGGQKAKLYFAKMIFEKCQFLILDEPTRNLSPLSGPEIRKALLEFQGGIICVTHDRILIDEVFETVYELDKNGLNLL